MSHVILEASETLDGAIALTIRWPNDTETIEIVSEQDAALLGYTFED